MYGALGGAAGILKGYLLRVVERQPALQTVMRLLLEMLVTADNRRARRRYSEIVAALAARHITPQDVDAALHQLDSSRLLRPFSTADTGEVSFELAHDYLLSEIKLDDHLVARKRVEKLLADSVAMYANNQSLLLSEAELAVLTPWLRELVIEPQAQELIAKSEAKLAHERRTYETLQSSILRLTRIRLWLIRAGAILAVVSLALLVVATWFGRTASVLNERALAARDIVHTLFQRTGSVPVAQGPYELAFVGDQLWVLSNNNAPNGDAADGVLQALDHATGDVKQVIPITDFATTMLFDGQRLWVADIRQTMQAYDPQTGTRIGGGEVAIGTDPIALAFGGARLWISYASEVQALDPVSGQHIGPSFTPHGTGTVLSVLYADNSLWVGEQIDIQGVVHRVDPQSMTLVQTITVGHTPAALAFDGEKLWVSASGSDLVSVLRVAQMAEVVQVIPVDAQPGALAFDGERMWVVNRGQNAVQAIDPDSFLVSAPVPVGAEPTALAFDGEKLWVSNAADNTVQAIDVVKGDRGAPVAVQRFPHALAVFADLLWVANEGDSSIQAIDPLSAEVLETIEVNSGPTALTVAGDYLWAASTVSNTVQAINADGSVVHTLDVAARPNALLAAAGLLWIAQPEVQQLQVLDPAAARIIDTIQLETEPYALAFDGQTVWVASNGILSAIDAHTRALRETRELGWSIDSLVFDGQWLWTASNADMQLTALNVASWEVELVVPLGEPATSMLPIQGIDALLAFDGFIWVANRIEHTVQLVDPATGAVVRTVPVGASPIALANTGSQLWVANYGSNTVQYVVIR